MQGDRTPPHPTLTPTDMELRDLAAAEAKQKQNERRASVHDKRRRKSVGQPMKVDVSKNLKSERIVKTKSSRKCSKKYKETIREQVVEEGSDDDFMSPALTLGILTAQSSEKKDSRKRKDSQHFEEKGVNKKAKVDDRKDVKKKEKAVKWNSRNQTLKTSKKVKEVKQPYVYKEYLGDKIKLKSSPGNIRDVVKSLRNGQREAVKQMGFGAILNWKLQTIPCMMGQWLASNYDHSRSVLHLPTHSIRFTPEFVQKLLGIPLGNEEVVEVKRARINIPAVKCFRRQFVKDTRISPKNLADYMVECSNCEDDFGLEFRLNFLILFNTVMGLITHNNSVNIGFLSSVPPRVDVRRLNWCEYVIRCLNKSAKDWDGENNFNGPLALLAVAYAYDQDVSTSKEGMYVIENVDQDMLEKLSVKLERKRLKKNDKVSKSTISKPEKGSSESVKCSKKVQIMGSVECATVYCDKEGSGPVGGSEGKAKISGKSDTADDDEQGSGPAGGSKGKAKINSECETLFGDEQAGAFVPDDTTDIENYYRSEGEYGSLTDTQPIVSQPISTQPGVPQDIITGELLDIFFGQFEDHVARINDTLADAVCKNPDSNVIKEKTEKWAFLLSKYAPEKMNVGTDANNETCEATEWEISDSQLVKYADEVMAKYGQKTPEPLAKVFDTDPETTDVIEPVMNVDGKVSRRGRPVRKRKLPEALRSPYVCRQVDLGAIYALAESHVSTYVFAAWADPWQPIFKTSMLTIMRGAFESVAPGHWLQVEILSAWAAVLNYEEKYRSDGSPKCLFCPPNMLEQADYDGPVRVRIKHFEDNMVTVLEGTESKTVLGFDLIFVHIIQSNHFYLMCFNLMTHDTIVIDNMKLTCGFKARYKLWPEKMTAAFAGYLKSVGHTSAPWVKQTIPHRLDIAWETKHNDVDCGVFVMRHMETYKGTLVREWVCGFSNECNKAGELLGTQKRQLNALRRKYVSKILLSDINLCRPDVEAGVDEYYRLPDATRREWEKTAFDRIQERLGPSMGKK